MHADLSRWSTSERKHIRELGEIDRRAEVEHHRVRGMGQVTQHAMVQTAQVNLIRQEAERLAPDAGELLAMIAVAGAVEMADIIAQMNRRGRR